MRGRSTLSWNFRTVKSDGEYEFAGAQDSKLTYYDYTLDIIIVLPWLPAGTDKLGSSPTPFLFSQ